jgi:pseudoazurin
MNLSKYLLPTQESILKTGLSLAITALCQLGFTSYSLAADHTIKMLNNGASGVMVFEPAFVKVAVGDTVIFEPTQTGSHYSVSATVPEGAASWRGLPDKPLRVKIEKEGIYLYVCEPHLVMGMVGVIQAGKATNLKEATAAGKKAEAGFSMNKDRFSKALALVK